MGTSSFHWGKCWFWIHGYNELEINFSLSWLFPHPHIWNVRTSDFPAHTHALILIRIWFELLHLLSVFLILMGEKHHSGLVQHPLLVFSKSSCSQAGSDPPGSAVVAPRPAVAVAPLAPAPTPAVVTVIGVGPALKGGKSNTEFTIAGLNCCFKCWFKGYLYRGMRACIEITMWQTILCFIKVSTQQHSSK